MYKYIFLILVFASCGTRKTSQTKTEFKSDTLSINNNRILKQNSVLNDIHELRPFDNSKPMIIDGKEYFNVSIIYDKSKFENFEIKDESRIFDIKTENIHKSKVTEKSDPTFMYIGIAFVICLFIFLWFYLPRLSK